MIRSLFVMGVMGLVCSACGASDGSSSGGGAGGPSDDSSNTAGSGNAGSGSVGSGNAGSGNVGNGACPDVSGKWTVTDHCEAAYIGMTLDVTESACVLSFASPFNAFSGSVTTDGKIMLSGPQTCSGSATATAIQMNCTPDPCPVKLAR